MNKLLRVGSLLYLFLAVITLVRMIIAIDTMSRFYDNGGVFKTIFIFYIVIYAVNFTLELVLGLLGLVQRYMKTCRQLGFFMVVLAIISIVGGFVTGFDTGSMVNLFNLAVAIIYYVGVGKEQNYF